MRNGLTMIRNIQLLLAATLILVSGCAEEAIESIGKNNGQSILFEFSVPDAAEATRATPTLTNESAIDDVYAFVFESGGVLDHWIKASITTSANTTIGTVTLEAVATPTSQHKLVFLANVENEILPAAGGSITTGMTYSTFESVLTTNITSIQTTEPATSFRFPMWGESGDVTISTTLDFTGNNAIQMLRSLAKIDVGVNLQSNGTATGLADFKLTQVAVCGVNSSALVIPAQTNIAGDGYVINPTVSGTTTLNVERTVADGQHGSLSSIYVPETYNNATTAETDRPYVIIKGIYLGNDPTNTTETYYRLDFVTGQDRGPVDLMRNYSYTFNITEVHREGYMTLQDAENNLPLGLSYEFFPSNATTQYQAFCYNDVGYLASVNNKVTITNHLANSAATNTYKAEYMGNTAPVIAAYMCDANGEPSSSSHFTVTPTNATTVTVRATADNGGYYPIIEYFKVYLVDNPDICLISEVRHNIFNLSGISTRQVYYGRAASDNGYEGTAVGFSSTSPYLPNSTDYFAIKWNGILLPASQFRITRGEPGDSFYYQTTVTHPEGNGTLVTHISQNFDMPPHDSRNYEKWYIEWWNPYENGGAGGWVEFAATFEQVGSNFRYNPSTVYIYFAATDLEYTNGGYTPGTGIYTGWTWAEAAGIDPSYQTEVFPFSTLNGYIPTEYTGCGAYWEGDPDDPVTGRGKWTLPLSGNLYNARTHLNTDGYLGIPVGAVDTDAYYMTITNSSSQNFHANRITANGITSRSKSTGTSDVRVRCVRYVE